MAATTAKPVKSAGKIPGSTLKIIAMVCMLIERVRKHLNLVQNQ